MRFVPLLLACLVLAGCASPAATPSASSNTTSAAPPTVGLDVGSVHGSVTDDQLRPLSGAEVALVEAGSIARTDPAGAFTFNDIPPGTYTLVATATGYQQTGKRVEVRAGEVTNTSVALRPLVIAAEPYVVVLPSTFYITFGWGLFDAFVTWRLNNATCQPCQRYLDFERAPKAVLAEPVWQPSTNSPVTNQQLYIWTERNVTNGATGSSGENVWSKYVANRERHLYTETELRKLQDFKNFRINVGGGVTSAMVQQKIEVWMSFGYVAPLPDDYSALPRA